MFKTLSPLVFSCYRQEDQIILSALEIHLHLEHTIVLKYYNIL